MLRRARVLVAAGFLTAVCTGVAGCGDSSQSTGHGTITLLSFSPDPVPGGTPTAFTITGVNFETVTGTTAQVRFDALGGATPFLLGTSATATVEGLVTSDTTITGTTPPALVCGVASVTAVVTVTLESGVSDSSAGTFVVTFTAPTVTSVSGTSGNTVPALVPSPITITGTGFGPVGGTATIRFTGDGGASCFADGTEQSVEVVGSIASETTITATTPRCTNPVSGSGTGAMSVPFQGASIEITLDEVKSCSLPTGAGAILFDRPDGQLSVGGLAPQTVPQTIPTAFTITTVAPTTNVYDPGGGGVVMVKFVAAAGTPFDGGTSDTAVVPGNLTTSSTITGTTPLALSATTFTAQVRVVFEDGTVGDGSATSPVTFTAPPIISNVTDSPAPVGTGSPSRAFLTIHRTQMTITGSNFDPAASTVLVYDNAQGPGTPIGTGLLESAPFLVTRTGTQITGTAPVSPAQVGPVQAAVRVTNPDGQVGTFTAPDFLFVDVGHLPNVNATQQLSNNSEMGIAVNPTNPLNIAMLCHDDSSNFLNARVAYSTDGGRTWANVAIDSTLDGITGALRRVDPRCAFDRFGNFYICYFTTGTGGVPRHMMVLQSNNGGAGFQNVMTVATDPTSSMDREFLCVGPNGANLAQEAIYVGWRDGGTFSGAGDDIVVSGATSTGLGNLSAFSVPVGGTGTPGVAGHQEPFGAVTANGDLHLVWIDYTADPGTGPEIVMYALNPLGLFAGAGFGTAQALASSNVGFLEPIAAQPNRGIGVNPEITPVRAGPFAGRVVVTYMDETPDNSDNIEVRTLRSDNSGLTWSSVGTINDFALNAQFNASIVADRSTGVLFAAWYDSRLDPAGVQAHIFGSTSFDGGATWELNLRLSDGASNATGLGGNDYLEYLGVDAVGGAAWTNWADNSDSTGDNPGGTATTDAYVVRWQNGP